MNYISQFRRAIILGSLCLAIVLSPVRPALAADLDAARAFVNTVAEDCLASFSGKKLSLDERRQLLAEKIGRYGDPTMTSADLLGRYWVRAEKETQSNFAVLLVNYIVATWSRQLSDVSPSQKISVVSAEENGEKAIVHTQSTSNEDLPSNVDWTIRKLGDRYVVADISVDSISLLRTMTADFNSLLRNNSGKLETLMEAMEKKIAFANSRPPAGK